jgi:ring-1,2-phenylacetyl-CoA epoxidase subunit PaaE
MNSFYPLRVSQIRALTTSAVELKFEIPAELESEFNFKAGQYITIKQNISGEEVRRAYSICSSNTEGVCVAVKRIEGGKMSSFLTTNIKEGDILEVMPPTGNFVLHGKNVIGICAGSGITPIISMMKTHDSDFTLIYGNQTISSTMFYSDIKRLNINTHFVFSREKVEGAKEGRIDRNMLDTFSDKILSADAYFICGPGEMINTVSDFLTMKGIEKSRIHFERFTATEKEETPKNQTEKITSNVLVSIDGDDFEFTLSSNGKSILDAAMDAGADVPFSCKGAVCCTCKAKVMQGKAIMDKNFSLSDEEVAQGYILTCQSHPISENIVVDYDEM